LLAKAAWQSTQLDCVHIHCCGNGRLGFRLTAGHFGKEPQSNQRALAPPLGTSPRLGVPVIRQGFGGPPPRAIHGAGRLNRHPCRFTPQIPVEFRPAWFNGAPKIKSKIKSGSLRIVVTVCYRRQAAPTLPQFDPALSVSDAVAAHA